MVEGLWVFHHSAPSASFHLPADPFPRFLAVYDAARDSGRWYEKQSNSLRHASLALTTIEGRPNELVRRMRRIADKLKGATNMFSPMQSAMRYVFAAHLVALGVDAGRLVVESERLRSFLRDEKMPASSRSYVIIAALVLMEYSIDANGSQRISRDQAARMAQVFRAFKADHKWITGADDLAAAALLSSESGTPRSVAANAENIYQSLRQRKYTRGNALQMVSHLLCMHDESAEVSVRRFDEIYRAFKDRGLWMMESDYDEIAALCFVDAATSKIVETTLAARIKLREKKYRLGKNENFSVAACLAMLELLNDSRSAHDVTAFTMIVRIQAIIQAQQAAVAASAAAASAGAAG